ncbi:MAG: RimK family protein [Candidatus Competibacteraceae bacterium]|nr:RimK family protein [Candidatus Competibacteraceae bacterium]MBK7983498.1 RimK family protein [Candidatus Competibacteraceae bacterium]MBK8897962.1 RimK family protein [Candidatus Competibacteraceae bacterium]MBK8961765.1 RimK family protein [Candidatus Competibacteraceae bacterium]MBK9950981.1 RimK family protein [Candidatus Competibacteraceae bacterium]
MADHIILVENPTDWKTHFPKLPVVAAKDYLAKPEYSSAGRNLRVLNLCRSYRYLSVGYYCSLLAEARRHRVIPSVRTLNDLSRKSIYSLDIEDLDDHVQQVLGKPRPGFTATAFELDIYFGQCPAKELQELARQLFGVFRAPLLRVEFRLQGQWRIATLKALHLSSLSAEQEEMFMGALTTYLSRRWRQPRARSNYRYDLAVLHNPKEAMPPSNPKALQQFVKIGRECGVNVELIEKKDYGRLAEFDALFIRDTTGIDHYTYQFAKKAESEGMVVIDDPDSILKCTNKVYLDELLRTHRIRTPKTVIVRRDNLERVDNEIPYPIVLKIPDGSFSRGVFKVTNRPELLEVAGRLFKSSDLVLAQEFLYTDFDWRVGILNRTPLFVCQYFMSKEHWQIYNHEPGQERAAREGDSKTFRVEDAPEIVVKTALKAAGLIGNGFYGVDLKQTTKGVVVIEINDNPNIDHGVEDAVLKEEVYRTIINDFVWRLDRKRGK